ncbi:MAG: ABC transporter transmembrane domain-containing protein [Caldisericia bacterium]
MGLFVSAVDMVIPMLIGKSIDAADMGLKGDIPQTEANQTILWVLIWTVIILIGKVSIFFVCRYTIHVVGRKVSDDLRNKIYEKLMILPDSFFGKMKTGEIMNRASSDVMTIMRFISFGSVIAPSSFLRTMVAFVFMFTISWQLSLSILVFLPFVLLIENVLGKKIHKHFLRIQHYFDGVSNRIQENLSGARTIKSYAQGDQETKRFSELMDGYVDTVKPINKIWAIWWPLLSLSIWIPIIGVIWFGGYLFMSKFISIGQLSGFLVYVVMLIWPMIGLGWIINLYQRSKVSIGRIWDILKIKPDVASPSDPYTPETVRGDIEIIDATLKYDDSSISVEGLSLKVPKGQIIGIVGPVGAGKVHLLRCYSGHGM